MTQLASSGKERVAVHKTASYLTSSLITHSKSHYIRAFSAESFLQATRHQSHHGLGYLRRRRSAEPHGRLGRRPGPERQHRLPQLLQLLQLRAVRPPPLTSPRRWSGALTWRGPARERCVNCSNSSGCVDSYNLSNCGGCTGCTNLSNCHRCLACTNSSNLTDCQRCSHSSNLTGCHEYVWDGKASLWGTAGADERDSCNHCSNGCGASG